MVQQERVAENVYMFQSSVYAQVNAGVIAGPDMAVVVDTLAFPEESLAIREFVEQDLQLPIRYVILTHYHADHSWGAYMFPDAIIVGHELCHQFLRERGIPSLEREQEGNAVFRSSRIVLPDFTFGEGEMGLRVGKKNLKIFPLPGNSPDGIAVLVEDDRVLFSGDTVMPIPFIVDGDIDVLIDSLKRLGKMGLENIVPGHGDIILRGEVEKIVEQNLAYLSEIRKAVRKASRRKYPLDLLEEVDVESCGKSRVLMGGLAEQLHQQNLAALYKHLYGEVPLGSEEYFEGDA